MKYTRIRATSMLVVALWSAAAAATSPVTVFYLAKQSYEPTARLERLAPLSEGMRALLAMYALQNGAGCQGRAATGLRCTLTTELGLGAQCSSEQINLVRKWFATVPRLNTRPRDLELETVGSPGVLENICYGQPDTASWQNVWRVIRVSSAGDVVTVTALGGWMSQNGTGEFGYETTYRIGPSSIVVLSSKKTRGD